MRQVTGSNLAQPSNRVSIQLTLGGHSFSVESLPQPTSNNDEPILFVADTPRVTLVPTELFDPSIAADYLALNGLGCRSDEVCVVSDVCDDMVAVIAVATKAFEAIRHKFGERAHFSTPLLDNSHSDTDALVVICGERTAYIRLYRSGLRIAEAIETNSPEEVLYYVARLAEINTLGDIPIYIIGSDETRKLLKKYYKTVI